VGYALNPPWFALGIIPQIAILARPLCAAPGGLHREPFPPGRYGAIDLVNGPDLGAHHLPWILICRPGPVNVTSGDATEEAVADLLQLAQPSGLIDTMARSSAPWPAAALVGYPSERSLPFAPAQQ